MSSSADQQNPRQTLTSNLLPAVSHPCSVGLAPADKHCHPESVSGCRAYTGSPRIPTGVASAVTHLLV